MLFLETNIFSQYLPMIIFLLVFGFISYFISKLIAKKDIKLVFVFPGIMLLLTLVFGFLTFLSNDWGSLGYLIIAAISLGGFVSSLVSSLILYFHAKSK